MTVPTPFCPGYPAPYDALVSSYPDETIYPSADFRVEWGPIFHRGRLDGTARVLIIGQDPAVQETIARRILVGAAGQRVQGLLARLGLTSSYVLVNTFLYSVYGQAGGERHIKDEKIAEYRHAWISQLVSTNPIGAIITFGTLAAEAYKVWKLTEAGAAYSGHYAPLLHPTYPQSAAGHGQTTLAAATQRLLDNWNAELPGLIAAVGAPDQPPNDAPYGSAFTEADLPAIPAADLPAGLPAWMRAGTWGERTGTSTELKRATIEIVVPAAARPPAPAPAPPPAPVPAPAPSPVQSP